MVATNLEAYLGIPMPSVESFHHDDDDSRHVLYATLDDLSACSDTLAFPFGDGTVGAHIELLDDVSRRAILDKPLFAPKLHRDQRKQLNRCEILRISTTVSTSCYDGYRTAPDGMSVEEITLCMSRVEFQKRLSDLLVLTNVARLGSIELADSVIVQDNCKLTTEIPIMDGLVAQEAARVARETQWPTLFQMNCETVWNWASKRVTLLDGFDGTPMGRAICAFSRIFERKTADEPMQLLWALVGLEALYVKGKSELLQQVREKSQVLLGPQSSFKKRISQMYDFRSRFVHGDLDFPGLYLLGDARVEFAKYSNDLFAATAIATAVLAATLQAVIRRDWDGLDFE
jgi:hypothetical protein